MKLLIMSDIHGNLTALSAVFDRLRSMDGIDACALLGDVIDYGMHSNEVVRMLETLPYPIVCNIRGNHEQVAVTQDYERLSSERGKACARYTRSILDEDTWQYIRQTMHTGKYEFDCGGKRCLAVHGSLEDEYWKSIKPEQELKEYSQYDYVFSGHSHMPHFFEKFYPADDPARRNKKKTIFINPGSVGQPRNLNPMAMFSILDTGTEEVQMVKTWYDVRAEQAAYHGQVDIFYKERLEMGV